VIDRAELADFLRRRRQALQPEDVGLPRGPRRRTGGLRREEVALLCHMSVDYYARLERGTGPQPSVLMLGSIARGLRLSPAERDHVFRLAGHVAPARDPAGEHIGPGLLRVFERLEDTPAEIVTELGETLRQTRMGVALLGDAALRTGPARSLGYRWFTDLESREPYPQPERQQLSRVYASGLRELVALRGPGSRAAQLADELLDASPEFRELWATHQVGIGPPETKRFDHPGVGRLELHCQTLLDPDQGLRLLVYTAAPGSESEARLQALSVAVSA
jgi:transcriptional regulator with XRE-family HTH domain